MTDSSDGNQGREVANPKETKKEKKGKEKKGEENGESEKDKDKDRSSLLSKSNSNVVRLESRH